MNRKRPRKPPANTPKANSKRTSAQNSPVAGPSKKKKKNTKKSDADVTSSSNTTRSISTNSQTFSSINLGRKKKKSNQENKIESVTLSGNDKAAGERDANSISLFDKRRCSNSNISSPLSSSLAKNANVLKCLSNVSSPSTSFPTVSKRRMRKRTKKANLLLQELSPSDSSSQRDPFDDIDDEFGSDNDFDPNLFDDSSSEDNFTVSKTDGRPSAKEMSESDTSNGSSSSESEDDNAEFEKHTVQPFCDLIKKNKAENIAKSEKPNYVLKYPSIDISLKPIDPWRVTDEPPPSILATHSDDEGVTLDPPASVVASEPPTSVAAPTTRKADSLVTSKPPVLIMATDSEEISTDSEEKADTLDPPTSVMVSKPPASVTASATRKTDSLVTSKPPVSIISTDSEEKAGTLDPLASVVASEPPASVALTGRGDTLVTSEPSAFIECQSPPSLLNLSWRMLGRTTQLPTCSGRGCFPVTFKPSASIEPTKSPESVVASNPTISIEPPVSVVASGSGNVLDEPLLGAEPITSGINERDSDVRAESPAINIETLIRQYRENVAESSTDEMNQGQDPGDIRQYRENVAESSTDEMNQGQDPGDMPHKSPESVVASNPTISIEPPVSVVASGSGNVLDEPLLGAEPITSGINERDSDVRAESPAINIETLIRQYRENVAESSTDEMNQGQDPGDMPHAQLHPEDNLWHNDTAPIPNFDFDHFSEGLRAQIKDEPTELDVFKFVFSEELLQQMLSCTNDYGLNLTNTNQPHTRNSRKKSFKQVSYDEMLSFLGLSLLRGQIDAPKSRSLFSYSDPLYYHPIFPYTMSSRRYEQILRCLYVSDVGSKGATKVKHFIDALTENFRRIYGPDRELSIDESLLLYRGRLHFRQYIKNKKARYGIKFYELTTPDGYLLSMIMYTGKEDESNETGKKTQKIVLKLLEPYLMKGHHVYMDNFYNDVQLSQKLLSLRTHSCGTLRKNRTSNPKFLTSLKLKKGEYKWRRKNQVYVSSWKDKRPLLMITTLNHPQIIPVANRFGKQEMKPQEVAEYNAHMGGVDRKDQMVSYYSSPAKSIFWYKKVIFHLLDVAVWNAYYIYKKYYKYNVKNYSFIDYRDQLIRQMLKIDPNMKGADTVRYDDIHTNRRNTSAYSRRRADPEPDQNDARLNLGPNNEGHWPEEIPVLPTSKKNTRYLNCAMCTKLKKRKETRYCCKGCIRKTPLCPTCFEPWHSFYA